MKNLIRVIATLFILGGLISFVSVAAMANDKKETKLEQLYTDGVTHFKQGDFTKAITYFIDYTRRNKVKQANFAYLYLSESYKELGDYKKAVLYSNYVLDNSPTMEEKALSYNLLSQIYFITDDNTNSSKYYKLYLAVSNY